MSIEVEWNFEAVALKLVVFTRWVQLHGHWHFVLVSHTSTWNHQLDPIREGSARNLPVWVKKTGTSEWLDALLFLYETPGPRHNPFVHHLQQILLSSGSPPRYSPWSSMLVLELKKPFKWEVDHQGIPVTFSYIPTSTQKLFLSYRFILV